MRNIRMQATLVLAIFYAWAAAIPAHATFTGRNGRIAFQVQLTPDSHYQIYTVRPNGKDLRQITNFPNYDAVNRETGRHQSPAWALRKVCQKAMFSKSGLNFLDAG